MNPGPDAMESAPGLSGVLPVAVFSLARYSLLDRVLLDPSVQLGERVSIQPLAVIEAGTKIGDDTIIGAGSYVGHETVIGSACHIYPHVTIRERSRIGSRVIIHSGAVIGADGFGFEMVDGRQQKIQQLGIVQIDRARLLPLAICSTRASTGDKSA